MDDCCIKKLAERSHSRMYKLLHQYNALVNSKQRILILLTIVCNLQVEVQKMVRGTEIRIIFWAFHVMFSHTSIQKLTYFLSQNNFFRSINSFCFCFENLVDYRNNLCIIHLFYISLVLYGVVFAVFSLIFVFEFFKNYYIYK